MSKYSWFRIALLLLAAGIVLAGPFIRDNGVRALWVSAGLLPLLLCFRLLGRDRAG